VADHEDAHKYTCDICGFAMNELGECPRCKQQIREDAQAIEDHRRLDEEIDRFLDELGE
jgi:tRNA(Ile2) C34 agmatinyltransferase TiaS